MNHFFILMGCMAMEETMKNDKKQVTYFFQNGRRDRLDSNEVFAKEMFYGYHYFKEKNFKTKIIEFSPHKTNLGKYFFLYVEKKVRNIFKLPLYWSFITNNENLKIIQNSDYLIFANNRMAASAIPMVIYSKLIGHSHKSLTFVMGLFSRIPKYKLLAIVQKMYITLMLKNIDEFIFLSNGEFQYAFDKHSKYRSKFHFLPFAVDLDVWHSENKSTKEYILFVGNDGNRDFKLAEEISRLIPEENFIFVSQEININNLNNNSKIINGSWGDPKISDIELRNIYQSAKITIIPLKNSLQPSGQSVSLQSIACGTPVLISHTDGFWDTKNFKDKENIFFAYDDSAEYWIRCINSILSLKEKELERIILSGSKTINKHYDLVEFSIKIKRLIEK